MMGPRGASYRRETTNLMLMSGRAYMTGSLTVGIEIER
jgi:hypothetical protein